MSFYHFLPRKVVLMSKIQLEENHIFWSEIRKLPGIMPHTPSSPPQGIATGDSLISFLNSQMS